ncbi:unnamed protein product [Rhizoctonia solani]|uniref:DUF6533 domain-containing protein n=1 Tax=Rhizoctonia solani TaxID=456999 RepID=A0A8H2WTJ4_9AGAM|nr:unnamed protein product [Rhizoctonia solani]
MNIPESETELKEFLDLISTTHLQAELTWFLAHSGITLLVFDWICTLDKEAEYLWGRRWSFARVIYYVNRVLPIFLIGVLLIPNILSAPAQLADLAFVL